MALPAPRSPQQAVPGPAVPGPGGAAPLPANLTTTTQYLVFESGLYALDLNTPNPASTDIGLRLPAIRLDATPPTPARPGRVSVLGPTQEGWIWRGDEIVFVLVVGGQAGMVLTIYRANDQMAAPEIRFRTVHPLAGPPAIRRAPGTGDAVAPGEVAPGMAESVVPLLVLAHVSGMGDVRKPGGEWLGVPGSAKPIEGFSVAPRGLLDPKTVEYQAILGNNWNTPWFAGGEYCGSRGLLLPLLGFRLRLAPPAADQEPAASESAPESAYECVYWGRFVGGKSSGPHRDGEACQAGDAPLEAMRVVIRPRAPAAEAPPDAAATEAPPDAPPAAELAAAPRPRRSAAAGETPAEPPRRRPRGAADK